MAFSIKQQPFNGLRNNPGVPRKAIRQEASRTARNAPGELTSSLLDPDGQSRLNDILAAGGMDVEPLPAQPRFAHLDQNWGQTGRPERPHIAVNEGPYRMLMGGRQNTLELFNKSVDPREQNDISKEEPEQLAHMRELGKQYLLSRPAAWGKAPEIEIDADQLEQLRALGYSVE